MKRKTTIVTIILIGLALSGFAQGEPRKFLFSNGFFSEALTLNPNGTFEWLRDIEQVRMKTIGNWQLRGDSLVLDSYPQRDRIIVIESLKRSSNKSTFNVSDKNRDPFHFSMIIVTDKNDTLEIKEQWRKVKVIDRVTSFTIRDSNGLMSPFYIVNGTNVNVFDVLFEHKRVFENETWVLRNNSIIPRGLNGEFLQYSLMLQDK